MGSWGTGIFQDDFACDLRGLYEELVSLRFEDDAVFAELHREFGKAEGIDESTFWIALAMLQHKIGRLDEEVKNKALAFIDSGRALQDWIELADEEDSSVASRKKQLLKAREKIASPPPPRKNPRPSKFLRERIDKTYSPYAWKQDGLYAFKTKQGEYVVLAATEVHQNRLQRHYLKRGDRFVPAERPVLPQPFLLLLNYRKPVPPDPAELGSLQPYVRDSTEKERESWLKAIDEIRAMFEEEAGQTFEEYERKTRAHHPNKSAEKYRERYLEYTDSCRERLQPYLDREQALERYFYQRFMMDPKQPVPEDRLIDLETTWHFVCENRSVSANWETLESYLAAM